MKHDCYLCHKECPTVYVDGRVRGGGGAWAIMCLACHRKHGFGLGTGKGQKYQLKGRTWTKVAS